MPNLIHYPDLEAKLWELRNRLEDIARELGHITKYIHQLKKENRL